jgi:hypothetical protein
MKSQVHLFFAAIFLFSGCATTTFYQLYKTESKDVQNVSDGMVFENEDVKVVYNFWDDSGNSSFLLFNKTESDIFIDLKKSHLILNGIAYTYFQNRTFSESTSSSFSIGGSTTSNYYKGISTALISGYYFDGYSSSNAIANTVSSLSSLTTRSKSTVAKGQAVTTVEKDIICIPAHAAKAFTGFSLSNNLFRDCDLLRFPTKKKISTKRFGINSTPLTIKNIISYGFAETNSDSYKSIETDFWVSEITNYPEPEFTERKYPEYCGEKSRYQQKYFLLDSPDRFYISYKKGTNETFKH